MGAYLKKYELVCERVATYHVDSRRADSSATIAEILTQTINTDKYTQEHFYVFALDTKLNIVGYHDISSGTLDHCAVHPRDVFQAAIATPKCAAVIVAHNHPSGDPAPSPEDIEITRRLIDAGEILGIKVLDHIITGDNGLYTSLRAETDLFTYFGR